MKLRIQGNSVRLRLTRGEVEQMLSEGVVGAAAAFPGGARFGYALRSDAGLEEATADFTADGLVVALPEAVVRQWAATDEVSIAARRPLDGGDALAILVEKDFACLAPREGEDESDLFPHPLKDR